MKILYLIGLLIFLLAIAGCKDEDPVSPTCDNYTVNLGPFYLAETSRALFPYSSSDTSLVFKNQSDEELLLTRFIYLMDSSSVTDYRPCPFDTLVEIPYVIESEKILAWFTNDSMDLNLQYSFQATFIYDEFHVTGEYDVYGLFFYTQLPGLLTRVNSMILHKNGVMPTFINNHYETITLGAKTFTDVYSNFSIPQNLPRYLIYMNIDIGIVGFEDTDTGEVWVFDRKE